MAFMNSKWGGETMGKETDLEDEILRLREEVRRLKDSFVGLNQEMIRHTLSERLKQFHERLSPELLDALTQAIGNATLH